MSNYLTTTAAASTYLATTAAASTYLTTANATSYYAPLASPAFTGTLTAPTINATTALQYSGIDTNTLYQLRAWVLGAVDGATGNLLSTSGKGTLSSSRSTTGTYGLAWTTAPSSPSCAFLQLRVANGFIQYSGLGSSGMAVRTYSTANALTDSSFSVLVFL